MENIAQSKFSRSQVGRTAFRDLRQRKLVNKRGRPTRSGVKFFSSLFVKIKSLPDQENTES